MSHAFHDSLGSVDLGKERQSHTVRMARAVEYAKEQRLQRQTQAQARLAQAHSRSPPRTRRALFADRPAVPPACPSPPAKPSIKARERLSEPLSKCMEPAARPSMEPAARPSVASERHVKMSPEKPSRAGLLDVHDAAIRDARRREAQVQAGRDAQQALAQSRSPAWWPRQPKPIARPRVASPNTVAAAERRLRAIRAKLADGETLSASEETDATARAVRIERAGRGICLTIAARRRHDICLRLRLPPRCLRLLLLPRCRKNAAAGVAACWLTSWLRSASLQAILELQQIWAEASAEDAPRGHGHGAGARQWTDVASMPRARAAGYETASLLTGGVSY
jgi:hypothetical protein